MKFIEKASYVFVWHKRIYDDQDVENDKGCGFSCIQKFSEKCFKKFKQII